MNINKTMMEKYSAIMDEIIYEYEQKRKKFYRQTIISELVKRLSCDLDLSQKFYICEKVLKLKKYSRKVIVNKLITVTPTNIKGIKNEQENG